MKIGYLAANLGKVRSAFDVTQGTLSRDSGKNVGNWAFWRGAKLLFENDIPVCLVPMDTNGIEAEKFRDKIDVLVIPAANWVQARPNFSWLAQLIEDLDKPCIMLGLGAQADNMDSTPELPEEKGVLRMLRAVSKRTPWIGVRGKYTLGVCRHYGIENVKVMGCPSLFINNNNQLGQIVESRWDDCFDGRIAVHSATAREAYKAMERYLFGKVVQNPGHSYVLQGPQFWSLIFRDKWSGAAREEVEKLVSILSDDITVEEFSRYLRRYAYIPYCVDSWINYLQYHECAIGSRIHGSILSLSAYLPTVCLTIDARTSELCETLGVPNIPYNEIDLNKPLSNIFYDMRINGLLFDENRKELLLLYQKLLFEFGLSISNYSKFILNEKK